MGTVPGLTDAALPGGASPAQFGSVPGGPNLDLGVGIDIGGTFTDFALFDERGSEIAVLKRLTTPADPSIAVNEGTATLLRREDVPMTEVQSIAHGTMLLTGAVIERRKECPAPLLDAITAARPSSLIRRRIREYRPLRPPNGRMRLLMDDVFGDDLDQHLWIPPSLPCYHDGDSNECRTSKSLVFSSWSVVPDAVAAVLSYEAERRMGVKQASMGYFDRQRPRPLQFRVAQGRLAGLRALLLVYPSPLIAQVADPLDVVARHSETLSYDAMRAALASRLEPHLRRLQSAADESTEFDTWQWSGPAVLDALVGSRSRAWLEDDDGFVRLGAEDDLLAYLRGLNETLSTDEMEALQVRLDPPAD